ncbi:MAG: hypothetical protein GTO02_13690, partial [Candidatus Dadabacteria bacterium]|nr:hypothetical protein [Candidatus Dadabacteria bacterium]
FGLLYGLNTLGAVGGVFISGFITIGAFGEWATILIGVVINLMVSILAFFIYIKESGSEVEKKHERLHDVSTDQIISPYSDLIRRVVLISFA